MQTTFQSTVVTMPFQSKNRIGAGVVPVSYDDDEPLLRAEQFAVSLRKQKKAQILAEKRKKINSRFQPMPLATIEDLRNCLIQLQEYSQNLDRVSAD